MGIRVLIGSQPFDDAAGFKHGIGYTILIPSRMARNAVNFDTLTADMLIVNQCIGTHV